MANTTVRMTLLLMLAKMHPALYDVIFPHGPAFRDSIMKEYTIATILRDLAPQVALQDKKLGEKLLQSGKVLAAHASKNLVSSWQDHDDVPYHYPPKNRLISDGGTDYEMTGLNPQPLPPKALASSILAMAEVTGVAEVAAQLKEIAGSIYRKS